MIIVVWGEKNQQGYYVLFPPSTPPPQVPLPFLKFTAKAGMLKTVQNNSESSAFRGKSTLKKGCLRHCEPSDKLCPNIYFEDHAPPLSPPFREEYCALDQAFTYSMDSGRNCYYYCEKGVCGSITLK